ncbi:SH3 domain-containing protein [Acutalibacter sp. 1XD8-33]|nr:SH3 domain-containing protein [Acutalibacter sp. 1XD8-33]
MRENPFFGLTGEEKQESNRKGSVLIGSENSFGKGMNTMKKSGFGNWAFGNKARQHGKRGLALFLVGCALTGALSACGKDEEGEDNSGTGSGLSSQAPIATPAPTPATAKGVKVTGDVVNVRKSASTDSDAYGTVEEGDILALLAETPQDGWYQVQFLGGPAYIYAEFAEVVTITVEQYAALMASPTATPTSTPEANASPDPNASPAPNAGGQEGNAGGSPTPFIDNEDGE